MTQSWGSQGSRGVLTLDVSPRQLLSDCPAVLGEGGQCVQPTRAPWLLLTDMCRIRASSSSCGGGP